MGQRSDRQEPGEAMTPQQETAIGFPCDVAEKCTDQRYRRVYRRHGFLVSTLLTVNIGEE